MRAASPLAPTALLALVVLLPSAGVWAQDRPRCAVMPFEGSSTVVVRRSFMRALEDHGGVRVVDEDEIDAVAGSGPRAVAERTGAALVITGAVSGRGSRRILSVEALDGSGRELARVEIRLRSGGAGRRALNDGVADLLASAIPGAVSAASSDGGGAGEAEDDPLAEEEDAEDEDGARSTRESAPSPGGLGVEPRIFTVRVGLTLRTRDAEVLLTSGSPRSWRSDPMYVELWAGLELRPLARSGDAWRGIFLRGDVAVAAGLGSRDERGASVATTFFRASGDLGYLAPIGDVLELGGALGFGFDAYQLGPNSLYPSVELPYVRPGVRARIRALGETLVVGLDLGYRGIVSRSALGEAFGPSGGESHGFDVGGGVSGAVDLGGDVGGIAYGVEASWVGVWHTFGGTGSLGEGERGTEHGFRLLLSAGWAI